MVAAGVGAQVKSLTNIAPAINWFTTVYVTEFEIHPLVSVTLKLYVPGVVIV